MLRLCPAGIVTRVAEESLGPELAQAVKIMRARHGGRLEAPAFARDMCIIMSDIFAEICCDAGVEARRVSGLKEVRHPAFPEEKVVTGHAAVFIPEHTLADGTPGEPLMIDWTNRQFDPDCPVPVIVPSGEWADEWPET